MKNKKCKEWKSCQRLWAFSSQLLKPRTAIYNYWEDTIRITKGTPQRGCFSPLFLSISLDLILKQEGSITSRILKAGKVLAFADDILILLFPSEILEIGQFIK